MESKRLYGQFNTTNAQYIVGNLLSIFPKEAKIIDPFAGNWDLLSLVKNKTFGYDIDSKTPNTIKRDSLLNPADYKNYWILTNPPYLARNKNKNKEIYDYYKVNDLYKAALSTFFNAEGGVVIVPLNFFCDEDCLVRRFFLYNFKIRKLNIFEEKVFNDTSYTVCAFSFTKRKKKRRNIRINSRIYPSKNKLELKLSDDYCYKIGGELKDEVNPKSNLEVYRLIEGHGYEFITNMMLRAVDSGTNKGRISLSINEPFWGKESDRVFATIVLSKEIGLDEQKEICKEFNRFMELKRQKYHSLFLSNYRNSTRLYSRKRISFGFSFDIIKQIIEDRGL